jgi:hypothetical protein
MDSFQEIIKKLDKFPNLQNKIEIMWGTQQCRDYIDDLCIDDRCEARPRQGFPFETLLTIESLLDLHDQLYPQFSNQPCIWNNQ